MQRDMGGGGGRIQNSTYVGKKSKHLHKINKRKIQKLDKIKMFTHSTLHC
jgi:hypothetical protein